MKHPNRGRRRTLVAGLTALAAAAAFAAPLIAGSSAASTPAASASAVTLNLGGVDPTCGCVSLNAPSQSSLITLSATVSAALSASAASVVYQISPDGANSWTTVATGSPPDYATTYDTSQSTDGDYDIQAVVEDAASNPLGTSPVTRDIIFANGNTPNGTPSTVLTEQAPTVLHGTVSLSVGTPSWEQEQIDSDYLPTPTSVTFEWAPAGTPAPPAGSPAGTGSWTVLGTARYSLGSATATLNGVDTTTIPDGHVDLIAIPSDNNAGDSFFGLPLRDVQVANAPPTSTISVPNGPLSGTVTLTATATDSGTPIASVEFQAAPSGTTHETTLCIARAAPYSCQLDTRQLADGTYDFRVLTTDTAGDQAPSPVVAGVAVSNPGKTVYGNFQITDYVVPATNLHLLGEIANSPAHETWAYGYTTAPPPVVNGSPLPFTAGSGNPQLVLLRYTDSTDWQIADVLRNADGSAFALTPGAEPSVSGEMTPSGEGWIVLAQSSPPAGGQRFAVFHMTGGSGRFILDPAATATLEGLVPATSGSAPTVELGEAADGSTYGLLLAPQQPSQSVTIGTTSVATQLAYGELKNGTWSVANATLPAGFVPHAADESLALTAADPTGPGSGWGVITSDTSHPEPALLAKFTDSGWTFAPTGLDVLDLTGPFANRNDSVSVTGLRADAGGAGVWISAQVNGSSGAVGSLVAHYDGTAEATTGVWCAPASLSVDCTQSLDANHPAALPDGVQQTADGQVAEALGDGFVDVYSYDSWTPVAAPGFAGGPGQALFTSPTDGWIVGPFSVGRISATATPPTLASWPEPNRDTLLSVALPPGGAGIGTAGAIAVGLDGAALHYDPASGWEVDPTPPRAQHVALRGVAYDGPNQAFAVGDLGTILDWNGSAWSSDPQTNTLTVAQLNGVAFASDGQGWAVGTLGTILHFNGTSWSQEAIDPADSGEDVTSVAVASGDDALAVAGGNLIERGANGVWARVPAASLPTPAPAIGSLTVVSALPDGGAAVAGKNILMTRSSGTSNWQYSDQPIGGRAVALSAFRAPGANDVQAFVSVSPPPSSAVSLADQFPSGDGDLVLEGPNGIDDLSRDQYPANGGFNSASDGAVVPDPVLAVAAGPDGTSAWAVGGQDGTPTAAGLGINIPYEARPTYWQTSAIWRYDAGGSQQPTSEHQAVLSIPAVPNTVGFAFMSSTECRVECASVLDAQPDVNLAAATTQIASFAKQPGGPAFAVFGGNAVASGPSDTAGVGAVDFADLSQYLNPLGTVPLYAAYGPRDQVPGTDPAAPWATAFGSSPAPFGSGATPAGITPVASGGTTGAVHRYYAFDATQNGGVVRVIVLDDSAGSLDASDPGQSAWLSQQLSVTPANLPIVVIAAEPIDSSTTGAASDGAAVVAELASAHVLAVFTSNQDGLDREVTLSAGGRQIPEYQGATLGYQQEANNGVLWYFVSVDAATGAVSVQAVPVVQSLALDPLAGLTVQRSSTLDFRAIGRRPPGTLASGAFEQFRFTEGIDNYVTIPATAGCTGCLTPSYSFSSSDPTIGNFVQPSAPGSLVPALDASGHPIPSSTSGLFCSYNAGTTTVSITAGQLTSSQTVTVTPGEIGQPCGTVARAGQGQVIVVRAQKLVSSEPSTNVAAPVTPVSQAATPVAANLTVVPPPPPSIAPHPAAPAPPSSPSPPQPFVTNPSAFASPGAAITPPIPPPITPVPPGGATAPAQSTAKREEKARKEASQSAYTIRPAGATAEEWFYPVAGAMGVAAVILIGLGIGRSLPGRAPALLWTPGHDDDERRRRLLRRWPR